MIPVPAGTDDPGAPTVAPGRVELFSEFKIALEVVTAALPLLLAPLTVKPLPEPVAISKSTYCDTRCSPNPARARLPGACLCCTNTKSTQKYWRSASSKYNRGKISPGQHRKAEIQKQK